MLDQRDLGGAPSPAPPPASRGSAGVVPTDLGVDRFGINEKLEYGKENNEMK